MTDDPETRERSLRSIRKSVDRTARLVGQLLDLSREESADAFAAQWVGVAGAAESLRDQLSNDVRRADVRLKANASVAHLEVYMASPSLLLALRNLLQNAIDHSPPGGTVEIGAEQRGDCLALFVRDEGAGVPGEELGKIRDRFFRGARERGPGSGLGLSIVELVLSQIGGRLSLRNLEPSGFEASMLIRLELARYKT